MVRPHTWQGESAVIWGEVKMFRKFVAYNYMYICILLDQSLMQYADKTLRPRQDGRNFPDDIFKCIFLNENISIAIKTSLKFVAKGPITNIPALVQIRAWRRPGIYASLGLNELMLWGLNENCSHFEDDILKCFSSNQNFYILSQVSLMFVSRGPFGNKSILSQLMVWC